MVDTDDTRRTTYDGRRTTPWVWHKLPTGELKNGIWLFPKRNLQKFEVENHCPYYSTYAFNQGWDAHLEDLQISGTWSQIHEIDSQLDNCLELKAVSGQSTWLYDGKYHSSALHQQAGWDMIFLSAPSNI